MFGLSFLNTIFLTGLIAGAVPVIIHLLNRRRVRRVRFSSLEFLSDLSQRRMRKINLRRILILILRTLAVLLVVFAFARPTVRPGAFFLPGKAPKNIIVCLDASYSMGIEREQGTGFTQAKEVAKEIVDQAGKNDPVNVVVFAHGAEAALERGTRNKSIVKNAIDAARLTAETTSIQRAVGKALELVDGSDVETGEIYVVSDFKFNEDSTVVAPGQDRDDVRVFYIPVADDDVDNVSIDRVQVPRKLLRPGEAIRVSATVTNHSRTNPVNFPVELRVGDNRRAEKVINLAPSATTTLVFPISFSDWGTYRCSISKNKDRLPADDARYFLLDVSRSVPVTLVRGKRLIDGGGQTKIGGFFYLEKALNPRGTADAEFVVNTIDEKNVTDSSLPRNGVVVWVNPAQMSANRMSLIERYVKRGGAMMVFLGGSERSLWQSQRFRNFVGMRGASQRDSQQRVGYTSFQKDHPVFSIFSEDELELLSRTRVSSYLSARGVAPDSVLAYVGGGDPALWELSRGSGRVLVFAAAPDLGSGDIPLSPMFLPLVHTSVSYLAGAGNAQRYADHLAGRQLAFDVPQSALASSQLLIRDPGGAPLKPSLFETPQGERRVICERPASVGFYALLQDTTRLAEAAVNLDARESNLSANSLPVGRDARASTVRAGTNFVQDLQQKRQGREVFAAFILLALAALVAESILGRHV